MAIIITAKHSDGAVNAGELRLLKYLEVNLPDHYFVVSNAEFAASTRGQVQYLEYDCIVITPHALYHIENKDWGGRLEGDDNSWYLNDSEKANPLKTVRFKTSVLASKLKEHNYSWGSAWIASLVTLSNPRQNKRGLWGDCEKATYLLDEKLIQFISDPSAVGKRADGIADIYNHVKDFIAGTISLHKKAERKEIMGYEIIEILAQDKNYTEYLCKTKGIVTANKFRIKEYLLDIADLSPAERDLREKKIKNHQLALSKMQRCFFILNAQFPLDGESNRFYEITDYLDESSLRAELRRKTFTQEEKLSIVFNIIEALRVAHKVDVYHRDLNPENIFLISGNAALANFGKAYFNDHGEMGYTVAPSLDESNATAYHAPELLAKDASKASDIYSLGILIYELFTGKLPFNSPYELNHMGGEIPKELLPTAINPNLPEWLDDLCSHTILWDDSQRWDNIEELDNFLKYQLSQSQVPIKNNNANDIEELKPGVRIGDFTLYNQLGKGGYSTVFKAKHNLQSQDYAIKIFNESISSQAVIDEYNALIRLKNPHIVSFIFCGTLPNGQFYTLMEYLEGTNLQTYIKGDIRLPLIRIYKLANDILTALIEMQSQKPKPIFHRDIKPQNIVWDKEERFVLIDFNVAATENDTHFVGTNPYLAPDLIHNSTRIDWDTSADTFALGVTLYELTCHAYPWGGNRQPRIAVKPESPLVHNEQISESFANFLLKTIATNKTERFASAQEMLTALQAIGEKNLVKEDKTENTGAIDITGTQEKDFLTYLNSLYSQSKHGNAGTRVGFSPNIFDDLTYTKTKLDTKLLNVIADGAYRLVIITGNAGDGKTAFIKQVENKADQVEKLTNRNGAKFKIKGISYQSNYDGSQDEDERANNEVLSDFFKPFANTDNFNLATEGRIIAINEGRLVDFLQSTSNFKNLANIIDEYFYNEGHIALPEGILVVNLNLRSVTARQDNGDSLFRSQVRKLTNPVLWNKCAECPLADKCFIKYNVDTLNDSAAGDEVINRMEWLIRTVSYKRELHITMRDLRSFIAYMISRDSTCKSVEDLYKTYELEPEKYWQHYYFNITSTDSEPSNDRLIKLLKETDIAQVAIPALDRDLFFGLHTPKDYIDFSERKETLLEEFNRNKILLPAYEYSGDVLSILKIRHQNYVRHQYFEGKFVFKKRLPYQSLSDFYKILSTKVESGDEIENAKNSLAKAISISEGCMELSLSQEYLLLSSARVNDPISKSYRRFPLSDFELFVNRTDHLTEFIEYESDSLIFRHKNDRHIQLTISLDLYEMLYFIKQGFSPSINDLRGRFVELQVFKNLLENETYNEVIVTRNDKNFFAVSLLPDNNKLILSPLK
jgi:serine/threonine protein kinase